MSAGIAHEINNPLTIIDGKARSVVSALDREAPSPEKIKSDMNRILVAVERISSVINAMKRISRDTATDSFESYDLVALVKETVSIFSQRFALAGLSLTVNPLPQNPLIISCRPSEIQQIIINLLNNAFDASAEGKDGWTLVTCLDEDHTVQLRVENSGLGIPKAMREKIFLPFFTTKPPGKGTGLGLSISRNIAKLHAGDLTLDESLDHPCFVLRLRKVQHSS